MLTCPVVNTTWVNTLTLESFLVPLRPAAVFLAVVVVAGDLLALLDVPQGHQGHDAAVARVGTEVRKGTVGLVSEKRRQTKIIKNFCQSSKIFRNIIFVVTKKCVTPPILSSTLVISLSFFSPRSCDSLCVPLWRERGSCSSRTLAGCRCTDPSSPSAGVGEKAGVTFFI